MITSILATLSLALSSIFGVFHAPSFGATGFNVQQGGTGSTTLGGILKGNGTSGIGSVVVGSNLSWDGTTLSASGGGSGFSTTSADYWKTVNNFFSTTSADYWETQQAARGGSSGFSTTSANYWSSLGLSFSTTSANAWRSTLWENNFPFTPQTWGNSTTSVMGFLTGGIVVNAASSTFSGATTTFTNAVQIGASASGQHRLSVMPSASQMDGSGFSTGGAVFIDTTNTGGSALNLHTSFGTGSLGRLFNVICDSTTFDSECANIQSNGPAVSALGVIGSSTNKGVIKASSRSTQGSASADANAAVYSGDIAGDNTPGSTAAQGYFMFSTGSTTGNLLTLRDPNTDRFVVDANGRTRIGATTTFDGLLTLSKLANFTFATSSFYSTGGLDLTAGCFSIRGTCISGSSGTDIQFSTTSADYYTSLGLSFSTTSADAWKGARNFFSTTSADYYKSVNNYFSTTSADYWKTQNNFFSTTSANYWASLGLAFSTTSAANYFINGLAFSTTTNNTFTGSNIFQGSTTLFSFTSINGTTTNFAITGLATAAGTVLAVDPTGRVIATTTSGSAAGNIATGTPSGTINGSNTAFTVSATPTLVLLNGAYQTPGEDYTYGSGTITFTVAPPTGSNLRYVYNVNGLTITASGSAGNCAQWITSSSLGDSGSPCGTGAGSSFSTTSANYWATLGLAFSTTSTDYWQTQRNFFSTTSADYWQTQRNFFSTTSANLWGNSKGYVATSAVPTIGNLAMWTGNGTPSTLGTVSTSTPTVTAPITYSGTLGNFVGGVGGAFSILASTNTVDGYLTAADHLLLSGKASTSTTLGLSLDALLSTNSSGVMVSTSSPAFSTFFATSTTGTSTINGALRMGTTSATRDNMLQIDCSGRTWPASISVGGCVSIDEGTLPQFPALFIKGNSGSGDAGQLVNIIQSGTAVTNDMMFASSSGSNVTALGIRGMPTGKGVLKINFTGGGTGFSNGAGISVDTTPSDAQGIFIKTGTGIPLNILDSSSNTLFRVDSQGNSTTTGFAQINGGFISQASSTFNGNATTTGTFFATNASSTKTFGANLSSCTGTNFLQWNAGLFSCAAGGGSSFSYPFTNTTFGSGIAAFASTTVGFFPQFAIGSSTIGSLVATSSITNKSVTSALILNSSTGLEGAYGGSNPCTNQVALSLSATGVITCTSISDAMFTGQLGISHGGTNASSFTSGSVLYYTGSAFGENNSNFFWNNSATALGLGTTTPRWALTVSSSTAPQLTLTDASATNNPWTFRSVAGSLFISTSSPSTFATSTNAAISILPSTLSGLLVGATTTNALSTLNTTAVAAFLNEPVGNGTAASSTLVVGDTSTTTSRSQVQLNSSNGTTFCIYVSNAGTLTSTSGKCN